MAHALPAGGKGAVRNMRTTDPTAVRGGGISNGNKGCQVRTYFALILCLAIPGAAGCSTVSVKPTAAPAKVTLSLDAERYQIGEPVWATVEVENRTRRPLVLPALDNTTLTFYWGQPGTAERRRRWPVLPRGAAPEPRQVAPGKSERRRFLFTGLTGQPGQWGMMAALAGCISDDKQVAACEPYYSAPVWHEVTDQVRFRRDPYSGIITRQQAIELARAEGGAGPAAQAKAVLVPLGESGLVTWVVFLERPEPPGKTQALEVNPYSGVVRPLRTGEIPQQGGTEP